MKKRNNKQRIGLNKRIAYLGRLSSRTNIVKIDKAVEGYIVVPSTVDRKAIYNQIVIRFALGNAAKKREAEELIKRNHARGSIPNTLRVKIENGVWPPFMPKNIKIEEVQNIKIIDIKK